MTLPGGGVKQRGLSVCVAVIACVLLGLLTGDSAKAALEGVDYFAGSPTPITGEFEEEVQLGAVGGMAVNYTGAGGVKAGTVYAATFVDEGLWIAMFTPETDGGLKFSLAWEVPELEGPYKRCGPDLNTPTECKPRADDPAGKVDVDVDESTGNVYAFSGEISVPERTLIAAYSPDGSEEITRFGQLAPESDKTAESPEKIHKSQVPGGVAVNDNGEVYVFDINPVDSFYHRLMKFVPKVPGKYDEYEYAGTAEDIGTGFGTKGQPSKPVLDAAGNIYVASQETFVEMYDFAQPGDPPACSFQFNKGGIRGITVDPFAGTPFFFSYKLPKRLYQLGPCNPATGKFEGSGGAAIIGETEVKPERDDLYGLAYDPLRQFSSGRPAGVLYGAAPAAVPNEGTGEPGQSSLGYIFAPAEETPPEILEQSVLLVRATSAQLRAVIDPNNFKTRYSFQYLTEAAYQEAGESLEGAPEAPAGEAFLSGTGAPEAVGATLSGLEADTAYRFRAVARSHCSAGEPGKICEVSGDVKSLRTYPAGIAGLPDGRAYELVSPANKNGEQVLPAEPQISSCGPIECKPGDTYEHYPMLSAPDGDAVAYEGTNFGGGVGAPIENAYIARRSESGWLTVNPTPSLLQKAAPGYLAYDQALAKAILGQPRPVLGSAPPEYKNLYAQSTLSPFAVTPLVASEPPSRPPTGSGEFKLNYAGASADLSRVYFEANDALTGATPVAPAALDGGPSKSNLYEWERATGQLRLVNVLPGNTEAKAGSSFGVASANSISADGSRAFWSSEAGQVFVREGAAETVAIPGSGPAAKFLSAATDGSKVLLANGSLYDLEAEASVDLSEGKGGFEGIAGQSDDLSHVYFVDTEVLTGEQENSEGAVAQAGKFNLYAWEGVGTTSYVATLAAQDNGDGLFPSNDWSPFPFARTAQASQAGRYLAFLSRAPLTGYDNEGPCTTTGNPPKLVDFPCPEVFLYDSESGALECASCNPSGASSLGGSVLRRIKAPAVVPSSLPQPRYLLDSGRLYFDSQESLSQLDTNEGVEDVYQYEAEGTGSCGREGGCVALISSGRDGVDSNFLAIDQSAKNVFFTTRERLLPADQDELIDLYDAREGGGFAENAPSTPGELPLQVPPVEPTPASPTLNDPGNVPPPKGCKKGQVKKKGKCVKKHKPKKKSGNKAKRGGGK